MDAREAGRHLFFSPLGLLYGRLELPETGRPAHTSRRRLPVESSRVMVSDMSKKQVKGPGHPSEIECLDQQARVTNLPAAAAAHEAP